MKVYLVTYANWEDPTIHRTLGGAVDALDAALESNDGEISMDCEKDLRDMLKGKAELIDYGWFSDGEQGSIMATEVQE